MDKNIYAAIAMALYEFQGNNVHDKEPGVITIRPKQTLWDASCLKRAMEENDLLDTKVLEYNSYLYEMFFENFSVRKEMLEKESSVFKSKINRDIITEFIDIIPEEWRPKQKDIDELKNYILYRVDNLDVIISTILTYNNR